MSVAGYRAARDSIRYGFAVGKVRVLETKVFGRATFERLVDATSFAEQRRILSDTVYGRYLEGAETPNEVEQGLARALDDFYRFLDEATLPPPVVRFFRTRYDFANLKGALKARLLGLPAEGMLVDLGTVRPEEFARDLDELPAPLGPLAERLLAAADESVDGAAGAVGSGGPGDVDAAVDAAMFAELSNLARESKSVFLRGLAALEIDLANARTLVRARLADMPLARVQPLLFDGGSIDTEELAALYALPLAEAAARLSSLPALKGVSPADLTDIGRLDVLADNVVVAYLRHARLVPVGPEPVIAYVMAREAEVMAVRTLLVGRLSGLSSEALRRRMRDLYV